MTRKRHSGNVFPQLLFGFGIMFAPFPSLPWCPSCSVRRFAILLLMTWFILLAQTTQECKCSKMGPSFAHNLLYQIDRKKVHQLAPRPPQRRRRVPRSSTYVRTCAAYGKECASTWCAQVKWSCTLSSPLYRKHFSPNFICCLNLTRRSIIYFLHSKSYFVMVNNASLGAHHYLGRRLNWRKYQNCTEHRKLVQCICGVLNCPHTWLQLDPLTCWQRP